MATSWSIVSRLSEQVKRTEARHAKFGIPRLRITESEPFLRIEQSRAAQNEIRNKLSNCYLTTGLESCAKLKQLEMICEPIARPKPVPW